MRGPGSKLWEMCFCRSIWEKRTEEGSLCEGIPSFKGLFQQSYEEEYEVILEIPACEIGMCYYSTRRVQTKEQ
ncbi:Hypothetical predicted protein [Pelobates cultripes]|uniref:Uncharacterized protein n=1 Tax=Pelobates cultripes TaxID=61616 RepID=A0AAD1S2P4_PELCU|nr:Hypothetical predicted protein [Pelobates cultripes]